MNFLCNIVELYQNNITRRIIMSHLKKTILPILLTGIWINISITIGWILILESYWIEKYQSLDIIFPTGLSNNIVWMIWGFMLATLTFILLKKFTVLHTAFLAWFVAFVMMWVVVWNVGILPTGMLLFNIPYSLLVTFIGVLICKKSST